MPGPDHDRIDHDFAYHPPRDEQTKLDHHNIRSYIANAAHYIADRVPQGRERSLAITKLEEAMMWANAGIARYRGPVESIVDLNSGEACAAPPEAEAEPIAPGLLELLHHAGDEWGPLGVALVAAKLTEPSLVIEALSKGR